MSKYEQQGYDAWVELWVRYGYGPTARDCPARWMNNEQQRAEFLKGWCRAKRENEKD